MQFRAVVNRFSLATSDATQGWANLSARKSISALTAGGMPRVAVNTMVLCGRPWRSSDFGACWVGQVGLQSYIRPVVQAVGLRALAFNATHEGFHAGALSAQVALMRDA